MSKTPKTPEPPHPQTYSHGNVLVLEASKKPRSLPKVEISLNLRTMRLLKKTGFRILGCVSEMLLPDIGTPQKLYNSTINSASDEMHYIKGVI